MTKNNIDDNLNSQNVIVKNDNILKLNTKKVAFLGIILAIEIILVIFGKFVLSLVPIDGFLVFEINFIAILICYRIIKSLYTYLLIIISALFRFILGDNWIQVFAIFSADAIMFTSFALITKFWDFSKYPKYNIDNNEKLEINKKNIIKKGFCFFIVAFLSSVIVAIFMTILNNFVLFKLWGLESIKNNVYWLSAVFVFNLVKYFTVCLIYYLIDYFLEQNLHILK